ncbi:hypothetical protein ABPG72_012124 [Tetrahymena utriculariae]
MNEKGLFNLINQNIKSYKSLVINVNFIRILYPLKKNFKLVFYNSLCTNYQSLGYINSNTKEQSQPKKQQRKIIQKQIKRQELTLLNWNISSCKRETFEIKRSFQPNIFTFQETRNYSISSTPSYNVINKVRENNQGGGIVIGIQKQFNYSDLSSTIPRKLLDSNMEVLALQIFHPLFTIILLNAYIPINANFGKHNLKLFQEWIQTMMQNQPNVPTIVCGDFNQPKSPLPFMNDLTKDIESFFKRPFKEKEVRSKIDWIFCNQQLKYNCNNKWQDGISDHSLQHLRIILNPKEGKANNELKFPDRKAATNICMQVFRENINADTFLSEHSLIAKQTMKQKIIRLKINQFKEQKTTIEDILSSIDETIRTRDSKKAFSSIKRLCILHPQKRDRDIFKCYIDAKGSAYILNNY